MKRVQRRYECFVNKTHLTQLPPRRRHQYRDALEGSATLQGSCSPNFVEIISLKLEKNVTTVICKTETDVILNARMRDLEMEEIMAETLTAEVLLIQVEVLELALQDWVGTTTLGGTRLQEILNVTTDWIMITTEE